MHSFTDSGTVSGLFVYLVYWFISPCILRLYSGIVSGLLVYLVYRFIGLLNILMLYKFLIKLLLVYSFMVHFGLFVNAISHWTVVECPVFWFIGLFHHAHFHLRVGLCPVYWFIRFIGLFHHALLHWQWDCVRFIDLFGLLVFSPFTQSLESVQCRSSWWNKPINQKKQ